MIGSVFYGTAWPDSKRYLQRSFTGMPEALFWGYDEPENMPGDARVDFFYIPTYLNTAFLMQAFRMIPELILERVPDFAENWTGSRLYLSPMVKTLSHEGLSHPLNI